MTIYLTIELLKKAINQFCYLQIQIIRIKINYYLKKRNKFQEVIAKFRLRMMEIVMTLKIILKRLMIAIKKKIIRF